MSAKRKILAFATLSIIWIVLIAALRPQRITSEYDKKYYWAHKTHNKKKFDFVFYGDSRVFYGMSPSTVVEGTTYTGYNFGFPVGGYTQQMLDFVDSHIDRSSNPTVVFGITPLSLTQKATKNTFFNIERDRDGYSLFEKLYLSNYMRVFDRITPEELLGYRDWVTVEETSPDGWMKADNKNINEEGGIKHYKKILEDNPLDTLMMNELFTQTRKWRSDGIRVFAYRPPTFLRMEHVEDSITGFVESTFVDDFERAGGQWIQVERDGYQTYDGSHLKRDEVIRFCKDLRKPLGIE